MIETFINIANRYGGYVVGGLIGAVVHRLRNTMSFSKFLGVLFISAFVGFCVGVLLKNYFSASDEVIFVACSVSGVFSKDLLDETQVLIKSISEVFRKKVKLSEKPEENKEV